MRLALAVLATFVILLVVPFLVYSAFALVTGLQPPNPEAPGLFLAGVAVSKLGTAIAFVAFLYIARGVFRDRWLLYAAIWWILFLLGEVGQAIGPGYTWTEAVAGVISESVYCPLAAVVARRVLFPKEGAVATAT